MKRLEKALQVLQQSSNISYEELVGNDVLLSAVERNFQVAIECVLDIGNHIIAEKGFETPDDNEDIVRILGNEGVISGDFAERIKGLSGFRNILVHEYTGIDYRLLHNYLIHRLNDFLEFARYIFEYLEKGV
ncbi:MAG TPA: DUF86 domain-containing protein [Thermodesulfovibrionales bacterium]|nr:DUF86 domain-containing protein [Thermodesulfovibrionales bacterium]